MNWKRARKNNMKKFILKWGKGSVESIVNVYKQMTVEAETINDINPTIILSEEIKNGVRYVRMLVTSETKRNYDYGSWSEFIEAEEIKP